MIFMGAEYPSPHRDSIPGQTSTWRVAVPITLSPLTNVRCMYAHMYMYVYIYIYIYVCVCVCVILVRFRLVQNPNAGQVCLILEVSTSHTTHHNR
jgi:hypothetical protein